MKRDVSTVLCSALGLLLGLSLFCGTAAAQDCGAAVTATKAEWRVLTSGNHRIAPSMIIATSDGRRLTGSQLNYAWALIDSAQFACADPEPAKAMAYISQVQALLQPPVRQP